MIKPDFAKPSLDTISSFCKSFNVGADESSLYSLHTLIYSVHFFSSYFISVVSLSTPNFLLCKAIISSGLAGGVFPSPLIYTVSLKSPSRYLQNAEYPFLYYCRSTPPKSNSIFNKTDVEHIMKTKLSQYFMNKGYYFQKVPLKEDTELMISNQFYNSEVQFQWTNTDKNIT